MAQVREQFATQVNSEIVSAIRALAQQGRQLQAFVNEALADFIEKRKNNRSRAYGMATYLSSQDKYNELYKKLAK